MPNHHPIGLRELDEVAAALEDVKRRPDAELFQGMILMWEAELALGLYSDRDRALELYQEALLHELHAGDRWYIEGMLQTRTPDAIQMFDQALAEAPFHERALTLSTVMLLISGRFEEAGTRVEVSARLFPENRDLSRSYGILLALSGQIEAAQDHAETTRMFVDDADKTLYLQFLDVAYRAGQSLSFMPDQPPPRGIRWRMSSRRGQP